MNDTQPAAQAVACLVEAGCVGTVKMSFDSGPYEITRPSINADRLIRSVERACAEAWGVKLGGISGSNPKGEN